MQTVVHEINNAEYAKKFDYFVIRNCLYKTLVYTLVAKYGNHCRRSVVVIEDHLMNALFVECLQNDNTDFIYEALASELESETISNLMPIIEIYLDRLFFTKYLHNKCIVVTVNTVSRLTTQLLFKILK